MAKVNAHRWLAEPILARPEAVMKRMFGAEAFYLGGKMVLLTADGDPDWRGCLFPAERDQHDAIRAEFPTLHPHKILPKWLYLKEDADDFEPTSQAVIRRILDGDPRFGIIPPPRKSKKKTTTATKKALPDGRPPHLA
ncbi:MAG: hypothetical protein Q7P63_06935 [Verrucomicrobiota bacterium JB022]|nr:hypothetical protein [Verrucomicrobiota bacterium JB022]